MHPPTHYNSQNPPHKPINYALITRTFCTLAFSLIVLFPSHGIEGFAVVYLLPFIKHWNFHTLYDVMALSACISACLMVAAPLLLYGVPHPPVSNLTARITIFFSTLALSASMFYFIAHLSDIGLFLAIITTIPFLLAAGATLVQACTPQHFLKEDLHAFPVEPPR